MSDMMRRRGFLRNQSGNVAVILGLAIFPLMIAAGLALDYSRASMNRTTMQAATDAAALATLKRSKDGQGIRTSELKLLARMQFEANFQSEVPVDSFSVDIQPTSVTVMAKGRMNTSLLALIPGGSTLPIAATSQAGHGLAPADIVLVLDITRSTERDSRMTQMKAATIDLLNQIEMSQADIRVSLVTFNTQVKLDPARHRNAPWLRFDSISRSTWNGCVNERDKPYNTSTSLPTANDQTKYFAEACQKGGDFNNDDWMAPMLPLSQDYSGMRKSVENLIPSNNTNIALGAAWGLNMLNPNHPLNTGSEARPSVPKIMILLSDGYNTESRIHSKFGPDGMPTDYNFQEHQKDTLELCQQSSSLNVKLYTIRLVDGDADLLRRCAFETSAFFDVDKARELPRVFQTFISNLSHLRLTH